MPLKKSKQILAAMPSRGYAVFLHDLFMAAAAFIISLYLRLGDAFFYYSRDLLAQGTLVFTLISGGVFLLMGLYRGVWRYASLNDLLAIARSATIAVLVFMLAMFIWTRLAGLPRSLPFINWLVLVALLGGPRFLYRLLKDRHYEFRLEKEGRRLIPVLLAGDGDGAELFIRALSRSPEINYQVVGILSETTGNAGRRILGVKVLGTISAVSSVVAKLKSRGIHPQRLILTKDGMDGPQVRLLLDKVSKFGMTLARLPKLTDFKDELGGKMDFRPIAVEDLLGRPQTVLDREAMRALIKGRHVLITGAGGSIGGELVRQICEFAPAFVVLLDNSEFNLYSIDLEMAELHPSLPRRAIIADVRDRNRIESVFAECRPHLVFHAAALKHVPMAEANIAEAAAVNVMGAFNVANACIKHKALAMVQISTDKAVNPANIMGATKKIAEQCCQAMDLERKKTANACFVTVRFGNVLGSTGSVVPLFQRQLARGGPLTVTHPDMKRYFMTIREAMELVLQALAIGVSNPRHAGKIFVLDMGEPVRILDLARQMIRLAGYRPDVDIKIEFTGLRPGEKLFEELFHSSEPLMQTGHPGIFLAAPRGGSGARLKRDVASLAKACARNDTASLIKIIRRLVPEYGKSHHEAGLAPSKKVKKTARKG